MTDQRDQDGDDATDARPDQATRTDPLSDGTADVETGTDPPGGSVATPADLRPDADEVVTASARGGPAADLIASGRSIVRVLGSVTAAMQPPRLVVGLLLAAALMASGKLWDAVGSTTVPPGALHVTPAAIDGDRMPPFAATLDAVVTGVHAVVQGVLTLRPMVTATAFADLFIGVPIGLWRHDPLFLCIYGLVFIGLTGLFGGALARMAACDLAGSERLGAEAGITFAAGCWRSMVLAPLAPLLIALLLWALIAVLGLSMRWPWVEIVGALLYGPALVLGALVAISLLGYALAFPLLVPAVACERCDAGEAQQRAFAYLLQRPARLAAAMALGIVGFAIGYLVVAGVAATTLQVTAWGLAATMGDAAARVPDGYGPFSLVPVAESTDGVSATLADGIAGLWRTVVIALVAGWVFSYYYAASTTIYLGLRESTDGQEPSEIWRPGMVHGTFVLIGDDAQRRATARALEGRWRRTLEWIAKRRGSGRS